MRNRYRYLAATRAWWDVADGITSPLVENAVAATPGARTVAWGWTAGDGLRLRRTSIICQLRRKISTDLELLGYVIDSNLEGSQHGSEFFIHRIIGQALR